MTPTLTHRKGDLALLYHINRHSFYLLPLYDKYAIPSHRKQEIYDQCVTDACDYGATYLGVWGANSTHFSFAHSGIINGKRAVFYRTHTRYIYAYVDNLEMLEVIE